MGYRRNKKNLVALICYLVLIIILCNFIYKQIISKSFRYKTPIESFEKSGPSKAKLLDIFEDNDIAIVTYKESFTYSSHIIQKDNKGWTPMSINFKTINEKSFDKGFCFIKNVKNKYVVSVEFIMDTQDIIPVITDSQNTTFSTHCYPTNNKNMVLSFLVLDYLPQNYKIFIDSKEISIMEVNNAN